jgi:thioredoxin-like negative regulator of GroEL
MAQAAEALQETVATRPRLVFFFFSRFSGRCRRVEGFIAQVLQRRRNHGTFVYLPVEAEERPDLLERFQVDELPALLVVSDGQVRGRLTHPRGCRDIEDLLAPQEARAWSP